MQSSAEFSPHRRGIVFGIRRAGSCVLVGALGPLYPPLRRLTWPAD